MAIPFDGLITLLVFLVGVPALILQLISVAERRVVVKRERMDVSKFLFWALLFFFVGLSVEIWATLNKDVLGETNYNFIEQGTWVLTFAILFVLVLKVSKQIPEQYGQREKIVEKLSQVILKESKNKGHIGGTAFSDLANLGKQCDPGSEREMVVNAFKDLVQGIIGDKKYNGDSFEELIEELVHMLVSNPEPKDLCCYDTSIKILAAILSVPGPIDSDSDKQRTLHAISKLGRTLLEHFESVEADNIILDYVDSVEFAILDGTKMLTEVSQTIFEIGVCATGAGQDFIAIAAIDKLTVLAENRSPLPDEFVADMLGLVAHLWVVEGSRQEFAALKLEEVKRLFPKSLPQTIDDARTHCLRTMYFNTADNLEAMKKGLRRRKKK